MKVEKNTAGKKKSKKQGRLFAGMEHAGHKHSWLRHSVSTAECGEVSLRTVPSQKEFHFL